MCRSALFALLLLAAGVVPAQDVVPRGFVFIAHVAPDGRVLALAPAADRHRDPLPPEIESTLREQLLARRYARGDRLGGTLTTWIEGRLASPGDDAQAPGPDALHAGPHPVRIDPPHAPPALIRDRVEADLALRLRLDRTGAVTIAAIDGLDALARDPAQRLRTRIEQAVRNWRFFPERRDGRPIEATLDVALQYRIDRGAGTDWQWRGPAIGQTAALQVPAEDFEPLTLRMSGKRR